MRRLRVGTGALLVAASGCSLFTSLSGYDGEVDRAFDGGDADPDVGRDAGSGATDAPPAGDSAGDALITIDSGSDGGELAVNGTFETGSCAPMVHVAEKSSLAATKNARSGIYACTICNTGVPMGTAAMWQTFPLGALGTGKYTLEAYAKTDGDAGNSLALAQITVKDPEAGTTRYPSFQTATTGTGWVHLQVGADIAAGEHIDSLLLGLYSDPTGPCVAFDDVSLVKD
jgi:hypothetical protein